MSGYSRFSSRVVAASIGLFGAVSTQAMPLPDPGVFPPAASGWADPVNPFARYGIASFAATAQYLPSVERPFFNESERLEYERQIEALDDISERIQVVIDSLGFLATDILEQYAASSGEVNARLVAIKETIDRYRVQKEEYVSPSRLRAAEAFVGLVEEGEDEYVRTVETVQQATTAISDLRHYIAAQETVLGSFKDAIQTLYGFDASSVNGKAVEDAVGTLRESLGYWDMPAPAAPAIPVADASVPVGLR
ncbi:hypothetical protein OIU34_18865 [Pararhizobium sp. BT-229]|uniref:hypothetical protein n=1 Tax=Pararhizobium sp. BT-229 TaxID=2986923 RepID=UPI0021F77C26|nr:hypothetical protein [Pararhizobium sp. BT-229]MCV9963943.1 hypothetical protein [Pararhizobium sp. BT-229]